ncbi:amidophosphoribosyltransferase, partial [Corynebacterium nasicanis]
MVIKDRSRTDSAPLAPLDDRGETEPREECGVFGVWAPGEEVAKLTYFGLFALQHRGQEAAGIAVGDGERIVVFKDMGLVSQVFDESILSSLHGDIALGHTRYSTAGGKKWENVQPMFRTSPDGTDVALGHNGNLVNPVELRAEAVERGLGEFANDTEEACSDTAVITALLADAVRDGRTVFDSAQELLPRVKGAFCLTFTDGKTLYAARDPHGVRPLVLGRL